MISNTPCNLSTGSHFLPPSLGLGSPFHLECLSPDICRSLSLTVFRSPLSCHFSRKSSLSTPFSQHSWHSVPSPCLFLHRSSLSLLSFFVVYTFVYLSESFPFPHECKLTVSKIVPGVIVGYQIFTEWTNKWKKEPNWMAPTSGSTLSVGCNLPPSPRPSFPFPSGSCLLSLPFRWTSVCFCVLPAGECVRGIWALEAAPKPPVPVRGSHGEAPQPLHQPHLHPVPPARRDPCRLLCGHCLPEQLPHQHLTGKKSFAPSRGLPFDSAFLS